MFDQSGDPGPVCRCTHIYVLSYTERLFSAGQYKSEFLLDVTAISANPMSGLYP